MFLDSRTLEYFLPNLIVEFLPNRNFSDAKLNLKDKGIFILHIDNNVIIGQRECSGLLTGLYHLITEERNEIYFFFDRGELVTNNGYVINSKDYLLVEQRTKGRYFFTRVVDKSIQEIIVRDMNSRTITTEKYIDNVPVSLLIETFNGTIIFQVRTHQYNNVLPLIHFPFHPYPTNCVRENNYNLELSKEYKEANVSYMFLTNHSLLDKLAPLNTKRSLTVHYNKEGSIGKLILQKDCKKITLIDSEFVHPLLSSYKECCF